VQVRCTSGTNFMQNLHFGLTIKTGFAIILSSFIASPAFAANGPAGYGKVKDKTYNKYIRKLALLDYEEAYSPEKLIECVYVNYRRNSSALKCGKVMVDYMNFASGGLSIYPSNPSLEPIEFVGFSSPTTREWCEIQNSNIAICYRETKRTTTFKNSVIRKKAVGQEITRAITECSKISL